MDVVGLDRDPVSDIYLPLVVRWLIRNVKQRFEDYSALYKVLAAFYEALRFIRKFLNVYVIDLTADNGLQLLDLL